ncbi:patatin-like phospholipase family protein, partial [Chloroflexota bacterium]
DVEFKDLRIPFACVATDVETGDEVVIKDGSVLEGVRASGSFPVIVPLFKWDGRYLVDGGLVNPVPVSVLKKMGAEFIIAVNVVTDRSKRVDSAGKKPNVFRVIKQIIHISQYRGVRASLIGADVVIEPRVPNIHFYDWHRAQETISQGQQAAQSSISEIKRQLEA